MQHTIIIHAGMPKTGSSSIQDWLAGVATSLRDDDRGTLVVADPADFVGDTIKFARYERGHVNSGWIIERYTREGGDEQGAIADALIAGLEEAVAEHGSLIVSSEAFGQPFWKGDRRILEPLDALARRCRIRVAYYVRPQHTSLEAAWRQWGFRTSLPPSVYVARRARQLDYLETREKVAEIAPNVSFEIRPFRTDLLGGGNVVIDFAQAFLDRDHIESPPRELWTNKGLPLEVVNALRPAPQGLFWSTAHDNSTLSLINDLMTDLPVAPTEAINWSRAVLQAYAHRVFEGGNLELIRRLGWPTEHFVAPPDESDVAGDLELLDELWAPQASATELAVLYRALDAAVGAASRHRRR